MLPLAAPAKQGFNRVKVGVIKYRKINHLLIPPPLHPLIEGEGKYGLWMDIK
jgi:hypothetical protein